jgi:hypothetical protein
MAPTAIARFWEIVWGAIALNPEAFKLIQTLSFGERLAFLIVLLAGLSQSIGQGIVLFVNRVSRIRFILSLAIAAILFAFSYVFWAASTWLAAVLILPQNPSFWALTRTLGLSYAPQILSFFIALPYLGVPISIVLSIWSFLAFLTGLQVALGVDTWQAFLCGVLGWVVFQILQRTIGRPFRAIGRWLKNSVAGVKLVTDLKDIEQTMEDKMPLFAKGKPRNQLPPRN